MTESTQPLFSYILFRKGKRIFGKLNLSFAKPLSGCIEHTVLGFFLGREGELFCICRNFTLSAIPSQLRNVWVCLKESKAQAQAGDNFSTMTSILILQAVLSGFTSRFFRFKTILILGSYSSWHETLKKNFPLNWKVFIYAEKGCLVFQPSVGTN